MCPLSPPTNQKGRSPEALSHDPVTRAAQEAMQAAEAPFFFGDVPKAPVPQYPSPHVPGDVLLSQVVAAIRHVDAMTDLPEGDRLAAKKLIQLQFYLHGYRAGLQHAPLPGTSANKRVARSTAPERFPVAYFHYQVQELLAAGVPGLRGIGDEEFREYLAPLQRAAEELPPTGAQVPLLLVVPHGWMPGKTAGRRRRALFECIRYNGKPARIEAGGIVGSFKEYPKMPDVPYLVVDVSDGRELVGLVTEEGDNPAMRGLKRIKKLPLTLDEGMWLMHFFGVHLNLTKALLLGTKHAATRQMYADLLVDKEGQIIVDDVDIEWDKSAKYAEEHRVPYCTRRILTPS